ncbi:MAG: hypothetical protein R3192_17675, partial [Woeseiaceae bacterium]|nr:hypothetical protein [Woeseiaceae bacterium]
GDRLRVTAQLVRASDGFHIWSNSYDRQLDDVFDVQQDIAEHIASALEVTLDDRARRVMRSAGIRDVDAFIAYQKGLRAIDDAHEYSGTAMYEPFSVANEFLDLALEAAPNLTAARLLKLDLNTHVIWQLASGMREEYYAGEILEHLTAIRQELDTARRLSSPGNQRDILEVERTFWSDDWSHLPGQIRVALQPGGCVQMGWSAQLVAPFGWADKLVDKFHDMLECDPMDENSYLSLSKALLWAGDADAALQSVYEAESRGLTSVDFDATKYKALLAAGRLKDASLVEGARERVSLQAAAGNLVLARQMAKAYWATAEFDSYSLQAAAAVGDRDKANQLAARIDSHPGGFLPLLSTVEYCFCGAPFDLDATPNLKARIEEADFPWPPPTPIDFPAKYW